MASKEFMLSTIDSKIVELVMVVPEEYHLRLAVRSLGFGDTWGEIFGDGEERFDWKKGALGFHESIHYTTCGLYAQVIMWKTSDGGSHSFGIYDPDGNARNILLEAWEACK